MKISNQLNELFSRVYVHQYPGKDVTNCINTDWLRCQINRIDRSVRPQFSLINSYCKETVPRLKLRKSLRVILIN
jgi:hypothetical protein